MFKTQDELKAFILWARQEKIKHVRVDTVEFTISDLAIAETLATQTLTDPSTAALFEQKEPNPRFQPKPRVDENGNVIEEDDPDLYHSVL